MTIPDGKIPMIEGTRQRAIEKVSQSRVVSLDDSYSLMDNTPDSPSTDPNENIIRAHQAYRETARQIGSFHTSEPENGEVERLRKQLADMERRLTEKEQVRSDPVKVAEQQYALAARYFNPQPQPSVTKAHGEKTTSFPVLRKNGNVVSSLASPDSTAGNCFRTVGGSAETLPVNAIRAVVSGNQSIGKDQTRLRMRLADAIFVGGLNIPEHTDLYGEARLNGQRLEVTVSSFETDGNIIPVSLTVYDKDGLKGIYVPNTAERTSLKDAAANVGSNLGSGVTISNSAGTQIAADAARGAISGVTQYIASKLREVKVRVNEDYQVYLLSNN